MVSTERVVHQPLSIVYRRSVVQASGNPMDDGMGGKDQACRRHGLVLKKSRLPCVLYVKCGSIEARTWKLMNRSTETDH